MRFASLHALLLAIAASLVAIGPAVAQHTLGVPFSHSTRTTQVQEGLLSNEDFVAILATTESKDSDHFQDSEQLSPNHLWQALRYQRDYPSRKRTRSWRLRLSRPTPIATRTIPIPRPRHAESVIPSTTENGPFRPTPTPNSARSSVHFKMLPINCSMAPKAISAFVATHR